MKSSKSLRRLQQQLAESREQPITADEMFRPPAVAGRDTPAMDSTLSGYVSALGDSAIAQMPPFVGYANLAILATHPLIRGGIEPMADEMVKKWIEFKIEKVEDEIAPEPKSVLMAMAEGKDPDQFEQEAADDAAKKDEKTIQKLKTAFEARKIQHHFRWAAATGHYQGGAVLFIDMGDDLGTEPGKAELQTPLVIDKRKIKPGRFKGLRQVEPVYIYPGPYNSTQPLAADFYKPEHWYVMGTPVHRSRLLFFIPNPLSVLFLPAYNFFGISTSQLVWAYVETFDEVRVDGAQIVKKFRMHVLATDMSQAMQENASPEQIRTIGQRAEIFNTAADNFGVLLLDKDSEEYAQHNTPITGLPEIASKHLEFVATMFKMPAVKLLGIEPSGFNSTGDADRNNWYDNIAAHQEKLFRDPLETVSKIIQLDVLGEIDSRIAFDFPPLQEMNETEQAQNQKTKAETGKALIDAGVITAEEERRRVASDPNSGYNSIDPGSVPEPPPTPTIPPEFLAGQDVPERELQEPQ
jgi:phage-related protein (TIGR01555 family)